VGGAAPGPRAGGAPHDWGDGVVYFTAADARARGFEAAVVA
jgi:hypothetical protein